MVTPRSIGNKPTNAREPDDNPEKPGGEGWLVNDQEQLVCQFKPDALMGGLKAKTKPAGGKQGAYVSLSISR